MVHLASFWKTEACGQTGLPDRSVLVRQKLVEKAKIQKFKCDICDMWFLVLYLIHKITFAGRIIESSRITLRYKYLDVWYSWRWQRITCSGSSFSGGQIRGGAVHLGNLISSCCIMEKNEFKCDDELWSNAYKLQFKKCNNVHHIIPLLSQNISWRK